MEYKSEFRKSRRTLLYDLNSQRLLAACSEHGFKPELLISCLTKVCVIGFKKIIF